MAWHKKNGAICFRTAGSHGSCDVVACYPDRVIFIQAKKGSKPRKEDWNKLDKFRKFISNYVNLIIHMVHVPKGKSYTG
ncbi:MAG: hypothetical protein L0Y56_04355 [Nitrospira sp.]|nr:hypothetical protein [Nitrospira sp.]